MDLLEFTAVTIEPKDDVKVYNYISKIVGTESSEIAKPCYLPKLVKYYSDIQKITGVDDKTISKFKSGISSKYSTINIYQEKYTLMLVISILHYMEKKKYEIAKMFFRLLAIKFYSSQLHKHFKKFCNSDIWIVSLDRLSQKHLFVSKKGIPSAIFYICDFDFEKYKSKLSSRNLTDRDLIIVIYGLRTKVAQSTRSFAEMYYSVYKNRTADKGLSDEAAGSQLVADKISMTMCTYGQIDKDALKDAILKSRIRKDLAIAIISQMSVPEYKDKIRFIIILISRLGELKKVCIEETRNKLIRKINSKSKVVGKYSVREEIKSLLYSLESGYQLKTIYDAQIVLFFACYISSYLRNRIC